MNKLRLVLALFVAVLFPVYSVAAINAGTQWEVRTTGSDTNGGAFDPTQTPFTGTDYSLQDTAQIAFTDLVIGATTTQLTSVANPFTSADVGNLINIISGTGFTAGRYEVISVSGVTATMDRSVGTTASTGGTGNLGGAMASPVTTMAAIVSGNTVWLKAGTYTTTSAVLPPNSASFEFIGFSATHGDNLSGAILTTSTNSVNLVDVPSGAGSAWIQNIAMSNTATTRGEGVRNLSTSANTMVSNCTLTGFSNGIDVSAASPASLTVVNSLITASTANAIIGGSTTILIEGSTISGSTNTQVSFSLGTLFVSRSLIIDGSSNGISSNGNNIYVRIFDSTIAYNAGSGIVLGSVSPFISGGSVLMVQNSILYGNTLFGMSITSPGHAIVPAYVYTRNNAYGSNGSGNLNNIPTGTGDITLTAIPFTNHSSGDYSLNAIAGGGALLKGTGYPGPFPGGTTTGFPDVGPVQSAGGGGTTVANYGVSY